MQKETEITPSFIQAFKKYQEQKEKEFGRRFPILKGVPAESKIFIKFKTTEEQKKKLEEWGKAVESEFSGFKQKHPLYDVDKRTFRRAFTYHPSGREILNSLLPSRSLVEDYYEHVFKKIKTIEQEQLQASQGGEARPVKDI